MGVHVMALTSSGGLPLFSRHKGNTEPLSFSMVASLNGVNMFCNNHNITLHSTLTQDSTVVWKDYENSLTLVAVASTTNEALIRELLDIIFNAMVLTVGIDELKSIRNVERLKRELRSCFPLIDKLLDCLDLGDRTAALFQLLPLVEVILCEENLIFQTCLDNFSESLDSLFACVVLEGCVAVATPGWWELDSTERKLLALINAITTNTSANDIPVFLPCKSPSVPFRLISICLTTGVWVLALCGPTPDLCTIEQAAVKLWKPSIESLKIALQVYPRNIPSFLQIHQCILGFVLISCEMKKFIISYSNSVHKKDSRSPADILRTFYCQCASNLMKQDLKHQAVETYWCSEYHKLHALRSGKNLLCALYTSAVPTHSMRTITKGTLNTLVSDKILCW
uniref:FUZ/MON1/HPS1 first Longin domain-containing protein n=2 Tax=Clastoptera arizonana TaxID=38151 RepID=A0A1B6D4W3_9HEMI